MSRNRVAILQLGLIILGLACGWFGFSYINHVSGDGGSGFAWMLAVFFVTVAAAIIGVFLNIILHEVGHLAGGLLTGYGFVFFSVLNLAIIKENGKLVRKKYRAPGTGGGCMLLPPDMRDGKFPYKLYISGGFLMNFLVSAVCFILFYILADDAPSFSRAFLVIGIIGVFLGLTNFIPHNVVAPSDGYMLFNLGKEKNSAMRHGWWASMRIQALIAESIRPRDIPMEYFEWVDKDNINDVFVFETEYNRYRYLMDRQELNEAKALLKVLCDNQHNIPEMQKMACRCELLFHELIGECRQEEVDRLYTKELQDYIKAAPSELNVRRLMYAYSRLVLRDTEKTKENLDLFHKACDMPLQSGFVPGEQELIELVDKLTESKKPS